MHRLNITFPDWKENYIENEFDCSEMSSLVYQYLKVCGLKPELKTGYNFHEGYGHSWVESRGTTIECTLLNINRNKAFYSKENLIPFIQDEETKKVDCDWWNSKYIKNKMDEIPIKDKIEIIQSQINENNYAWVSASEEDKIALQEANKIMTEMIDGSLDGVTGTWVLGLE